MTSTLRARMDFIRYANCWEDPALLVQAIRPNNKMRILSICSSGDNSLSLLAAGAAEVVAFDLNPAQIACLDLRIACLRNLDHDTLVDFLGARQTLEDVSNQDKSRRLAIWSSIRCDLPSASRDFWDGQKNAISQGAIHSGRFEAYFNIFRRRMLPLVHGRKRIEQLQRERSRSEREAFHDTQWDGWRWRTLFALFFSRRTMGLLGRDPSFFDHVEGSVAEHIRARTRHALVELSTHDNPWLAYILDGSFQRALPPWMEPANVEILRSRLDRIHTHLGDLGSAAKLGPFQGANLSDIFEYMDPDTMRIVTDQLATCTSAGSPIAYWNLLVPRSLTATRPGAFSANGEESKRLHQGDRAWFYGQFHVDTRTPLP